jgi:cell division protein FtsX
MNLTSDMKRILRSGLINFYRNTFISFASVLTMTITLLVIGSTIVLMNFLTQVLVSPQRLDRNKH